MVQALLADRAEQEAAEPAEAPGPDHQHVRLAGRFEQGRDRQVALHAAGHPAGVVAQGRLDEGPEGGIGLVLVVVRVEPPGAVRVVLGEQVPGQQGDGLGTPGVRLTEGPAQRGGALPEPSTPTTMSVMPPPFPGGARGHQGRTALPPRWPNALSPPRPTAHAEHMRALVTYGSKRGGTAGLAGMVATALRRRGLEVDVTPAADVASLRPYDLVVVGGALYCNRWHRDARRFVRRRSGAAHHARLAVQQRPLGDDEQVPDIPPTRQVAALARRIGARGHVTFGGTLAPDARGLVAHSLAARMAGDWRDPAAVDRWASEIVRSAAPEAVPHRRGFTLVT